MNEISKQIKEYYEIINSFSTENIDELTEEDISIKERVQISWKRL